MRAHFARSFWTAVMTMAALLCSVGLARAAIYQGMFDPSYDTTRFPDVKYEGLATFFVPDSCLAPPSYLVKTLVSDGAPCSALGMSLLSAKVEFRSISTNTLLETLLFVPPLISPDPVSGAYIEYSATTMMNEVVGINTSVIGPKGSSTLGGNLVEMVFSDTMVYLYDTNSSGTRSAGSPAQFVEIARINVPEPGSIALTLGALAAAGWVGRRRRG